MDKMPLQQQQQPPQTAMAGYGVPTIPQQPYFVREENLEVQKWMTDIEFFREKVIYKKFCGWTEIKTIDTKTILNVSSTTTITKTFIDYDNRVMSEHGGDYLLGKLEPLISPPAATSTSTRDDIDNEFEHIVITAYHKLLRDPFEHNMYQFRCEDIDDVVSFLYSFRIIAQKSDKALTIKEWRSSYSSSMMNMPYGAQMPNPMPQKKFGIF